MQNKAQHMTLSTAHSSPCIKKYKLLNLPIIFSIIRVIKITKSQSRECIFMDDFFEQLHFPQRKLMNTFLKRAPNSWVQNMKAGKQNNGWSAGSGVHLPWVNILIFYWLLLQARVKCTLLTHLKHNFISNYDFLLTVTMGHLLLLYNLSP